MAGKKKVDTIKLTKEKPIVYSGQVIIKGIKKGKVTSTKTYHNEGTTELFKFLLNCLAGNWLPEARPSLITTGQLFNGQIIYVSNTLRSVSEVYVTGEDDDIYVEYKFLLPGQPQYATSGFDRILLYSEANRPLQVVDGQIVDPKYSMIISLEGKHQSTDEEILIIWQLKIKNPSVNN